MCFLNHCVSWWICFLEVSWCSLQAECDVWYDKVKNLRKNIRWYTVGKLIYEIALFAGLCWCLVLHCWKHMLWVLSGMFLKWNVKCIRMGITVWSHYEDKSLHLWWQIAFYGSADTPTWKFQTKFFITKPIYFPKWQFWAQFSPNSVFSAFLFYTEFSPLKEGSCRTIKVKALQQGHTKVVATYDHGGISLQSAVTIATYDKLIVSIVLNFRCYICLYQPSDAYIEKMVIAYYGIYMVVRWVFPSKRVLKI